MTNISRLARLSFSLSASVAIGALALSCQDTVVCPPRPKMTTLVYERLVMGGIEKVDLLLVVDDSPSMSDKRALLALAVPDLVSGLVSPPCVDALGAPVKPGGTDPSEGCPAGSSRLFDPITDIHIGLITTSLGSHGADSCAGTSAQDGKGHLVFRPDPSSENLLPTYENKGFLAWDPLQRRTPPGEADLAFDSSADPGDTALLPALHAMIAGAGSAGCEYESQLESWYRFLVDPEPYAALVVDEKGSATPTGIDQTLLAQRKAFLRPDSLLAIVVLGDENDCSVRERGQYNVVLREKNADGTPFRMPRARASCESDPEGVCCTSCAQPGPKDDKGEPLCPPDPTCVDESGTLARLGSDEDDLHLRCWDQKRRFGIDFLHPIERYTRALTSPTVLNREGKEVQNPLFSDLDPDDGVAALRTPGMVVLTGITGVPWQDVARDPEDLTKGLKDASELLVADELGKTAWDLVLGDPAAATAPLDPLMIESPSPRSGTHPITLEAVATVDTPLANSINGHDFPGAPLLEYACTFTLPLPLGCGEASSCLDPPGSPVYDPPYEGKPTSQIRAGARPATRLLSLLKSLGPQGVVASACPAQTSDPSAADFGYRPALAAMVHPLEAQVAGQCASRALEVDAGGRIACALIEARPSRPNGVCCAPEEARLVPSADKEGLLAVIAEDSAVVASGYDCLCEIPQLSGNQPGEALYACQNDASETPLLDDGTPVDGYCYLDALSTPAVGDPALVANCPAGERRMLRFAGKGRPGRSSVVFLACGDLSGRGGEECAADR